MSLRSQIAALLVLAGLFNPVARGESDVAKFIAEMNQPKPSPEFLKALVNVEGIDKKKPTRIWNEVLNF